MRIKDMRQGLHMLLHTQGTDGLLHLHKRLKRRLPVAVLLRRGARLSVPARRLNKNATQLASSMCGEPKQGFK